MWARAGLQLEQQRLLKGRIGAPPHAHARMPTSAQLLRRAGKEKDAGQRRVGRRALADGRHAQVHHVVQAVVRRAVGARELLQSVERRAAQACKARGQRV